MYEIITTVLKRSDDSASNVGYALVYQCLRTITRIYPSQELLDQATLTISRFLSSQSKNLKYMGIMGLIQIVKIDPKYTLDYQNMVVDCLEDADDTLKIRTLDLLFKMTNTQNVEPIVDKLLSYLKAAPIESTARKDLVFKINELGEKFAPSKSWYIRTMNKVFEMGGDLITQNITNKFIASLCEYQKSEEGEAFRESTIKIYLKVLKKNPSIAESLMQVIAWIMGEYASEIPDQEKVNQIIDELCNQVYIGYENHVTIGMIVSALGKLHLAQGFAPNPHIDMVMRDLSTSKHIGVQQRCLEYKALKEIHTQLPNDGRGIFKGTPMNEEQLQMEGLDLDLSFLGGFVEEQRSAGKPVYDPSKSLLSANASALPTSTLNFKAYKQEQPVFARISDPAAGSSGFAPVQVNTQGSSADANASLQLKVNSKQVWGSQGAEEAKPAQKDSGIAQPSENPSTAPVSIVATGSVAQKKEPAKPYVDEKKEKMKNALFSGISAKKSEESEDEKKVDEQPAGEVNLLDFDSGPAVATAPTTTDDLLNTGTASSGAAQNSNNLLDVLDSNPPQA